MPQGIPAKGAVGNAILYAGDPVFLEMEITTATSCYPGTLVITDGSLDYGVITAPDNSVIVLGVLDVEPTELITTIYNAGDQAKVLTGDIIVWLKKISGATITRGLRVQCAGAGMVDQYATAQAAVGYSLHAASGDGTEWILVKLQL
jgi:hypothetical protein